MNSVLRSLAARMNAISLPPPYRGSPMMTKQPIIERVAPALGEIRAYRGWRLIGDRLYSVITEAEWLPGEAMEGNVDGFVGDTLSAGPIPTGVYAWNNSRLSDDYMLSRFLTSSHNLYNYALGTVDLSGEVVWHRLGYRAQFARIASIDTILSHYPQHMAKRAWIDLRRRYQLLPVEPAEPINETP